MFNAVLHAQITACLSDLRQDGILRGDPADTDADSKCAVCGEGQCPSCDVLKSGDNASDFELHGHGGMDVSGFGGVVTAATMCLTFQKDTGSPNDTGPFIL